MNKIRNVILLILGFLSLSFCLKEKKETFKLFVGYVGGFPVFDSYQEKKLFIIKNGSEEFLKQYKNSYRVICIDNSYDLYEENLKNGIHNLIINTGSSERKIGLRTPLTFIGSNMHQIAFTDQKDESKIKLIDSLGKVNDLKIKGYVNKVINKCLYYTVDAPMVNFDGANVNLYKLDIGNPNSKPIKIMSNTVGESLVIIPNEKFVYDVIFVKGEGKPSIYSIELGKFKILNIEDKFMNATPFYSVEKKCLVFYNPKTLEMKFIDIPKEFDLKR
jgi:hypothetical protein